MPLFGALELNLIKIAKKESLDSKSHTHWYFKVPSKWAHEIKKGKGH